ARCDREWSIDATAGQSISGGVADVLARAHLERGQGHRASVVGFIGGLLREFRRVEDTVVVLIVFCQGGSVGRGAALGKQRGSARENERYRDPFQDGCLGGLYHGMHVLSKAESVGEILAPVLTA